MVSILFLNLENSIGQEEEVWDVEDRSGVGEGPSGTSVYLLGLWWTVWVGADRHCTLTASKGGSFWGKREPLSQCWGCRRTQRDGAREGSPSSGKIQAPGPPSLEPGKLSPSSANREA